MMLLLWSLRFCLVATADTIYIVCILIFLFRIKYEEHVVVPLHAPPVIGLLVAWSTHTVLVSTTGSVLGQHTTSISIIGGVEGWYTTSIQLPVAL
jgi:hypothetical protein